MVTTDHPAAHTRRHPQRNLARFLMRHAGPLPRTHEPSAIGEVLMARTANRQPLDPRDRKAEARMRKVWAAANGYFPHHAMPVPRFGGDGTYGAVGFATNPQGQPVPLGIRYDRGSARALTSKDPGLRQEALRTLLHEWAHNFQNPALYKERRSKRLEGGAEAFAFAVAPMVARELGEPYKRRGPNGAAGSLRFSEYRGDAARVLRNRGMGWIMRGQFGQ